MKFIILLFICALSVSSCCSTKNKQAVEKETLVKETLALKEKVSVTKGTLINTTTPINKTPEVPKKPIAPKTPEVLVSAKQEAVLNDTKAEMKQAITTPVTTPITTEIQTSAQKTSLIHEGWNILLDQYVTRDGRVNYTAFKTNRSELSKYIALLGENLPADEDSKDSKLAYWMNAYNAMTVDLIIRNLPISSIKDIKNPWEQRLWKLGAKWYNLDEIEHQILRKMGDARIHFGINCASFSCPPLLNEAFTEANTQELLDTLATQFVNDTKRNTISENEIEISNIFKWFSKDFKQDGSLIDFLNKYSSVKISSNAKVRYMKYDWNLNK